MGIDHWSLVYDDYVPEQEGLREALCTLGNGYFATRGCFSEETASAVHYPGTYLAGCYNRLTTKVAGRDIENEDLVNCPNWLPISFSVDGGAWFSLNDVTLHHFKQELQLKEGTFNRVVRFTDRYGRTSRLEEKRLVHMEDHHLAAISWNLTAENWSGEVAIVSGLDGRVVNEGVRRYRSLSKKHLTPLVAEAVDDRTIYLKVETNQSEVRIAMAARHRLTISGAPLVQSGRLSQEKAYIGYHQTVKVQEGQRIELEKVVSLFTSRDHACAECGLEAISALKRAPLFSQLLQTHRQVWEGLWHQFDMQLETAEKSFDVQLVVRLHLFHILQTASPHTIDLDAGVPARGWHGEAYRGHIFWDELFIFPLLNFRMPKLTTSLLRYRYRRLSQARLAAESEGLKGALFPWQSGSNGREESQKVHLNPVSGRWIEDLSFRQRHVNAAIAYNVWQYYQVSWDIDFMLAHGVELLVEIARFWASIARFNVERDRYEIRGVMGPDEYHDAYPNREEGGLDNNAYTNLMAVWVLARTRELLNAIAPEHRSELFTRHAITEGEMDGWGEISKKMYLPFHDEGILSQFEGYGELNEFDWEGYRQKYGDIARLDRILEGEGDSCNRYKVSKQADVLMLFYLFSADELQALFERLEYPFDSSMIQKNIEYYMQRTAHGSTLSRLVHSWVAARADRSTSWELFLGALKSDVADVQGGTTAEGIHLGAMAGTIDLLQRCYAGVRAVSDVLWFNPLLPDALRRLQFMVRYRRHTLDVDLSHERLVIVNRHSVAEPIQVGYDGQIHQLAAGETLELRIL